MLLKLIGWLTPNLVNAIAGPFLQLAESYFKKKISLEELHVKMGEVLMNGFASVEKANVEALTSTWSEFMHTAEKVRIMQIGWAVALFSQVFVLFWHQWAIPFMVAMGWFERYPSSGTTVEYAYALVAALLGLAPAVFRGGAPGGGFLERLRVLVTGR